MAEDLASFIGAEKEKMKKNDKFYWNDVVKLIVILKDGRRITLGEKEIKSIVSALTLSAIHGF